MAVLFITHDLGLIAEMADDVLTMYMGQIVEAGSADQVFYGHTHPYTEGLLKSIPIVAAEHHRLAPIRGSVPNPYAQPLRLPFPLPLPSLHRRDLRSGAAPLRSRARPPQQVLAA